MKEPWESVASFLAQASHLSNAMEVPPPQDLARHTRGLLAFTRALCAQEADAADLSQSALVAALERPRAQRSSLAGWLRGTSRILEVRRLRQGSARVRREAAAARSEELPSTAERAERLETQGRVLQLVAELPEEQAEAIYLRFWEEQPPRRIASLLDVPIETVKTRLKRGLLELRSRMDAETTGGRERWLGALGAGVPTLPAPAGGLALVSWFSFKMAAASVALLVLAGLGLEHMKRQGPSAPWQEVSVDSPHGEETLHAEAKSNSAAAQTDSDRVAIQSSEVAVESAALMPRIVEGQVLEVTGQAGGGAGRPAPGVEVSLSFGWVDLEPMTTTADDEGRFKFVLDEDKGDLSTASVSVDADERFLAASAQVVKDAQGVREATVEVRRYLMGTLTGTVVGVEPGPDGRFSPLEGMTVRATRPAERAELEGKSAAPRHAKTDERGRFAFPQLPQGYELTLDSPDWVGIYLTEKNHPSAEGVWPEIQMLAVAAARLEVTVLEHDGTPLKEATVSVSRADCETGARAAFQRRPEAQSTDSSGVASLEGVWSHQRLEVHVRHGKHSVTIERHPVPRDRPLGQGSTAAGALLIAQPGETLRCTIHMPELRRITGRVIDRQGQPMKDMGVWLRSFRRGDATGRAVSMAGEVDAEGRFEILYPARETRMGDGLLAAAGKDFIRLGMRSKNDAGNAYRIVSLDQKSMDVELQLQDLVTISGTVTDTGGGAVRARVVASATDEQALPGRLPSGLSNTTRAAKDGSFALKGLPKGNYELEFSSSGLAPVLLTGVAAGTSELKIVMEEETSSIVKVVAIAPPDRTIAKMGLLDMRLEPGDASGEGWTSLGSVTEVTEPRSLPRFQGAVGAPFLLESGKRVRPRRSLDRPVKGATSELLGQPGPALIALRYVVDNEGRYLCPMSTGPVMIPKGETTLRFHVRPSGSLEGRVTTAGESEQAGDAFTRVPYYANLRLPSGEYVRVPDKRVELGTLGTFKIERAPSGTLELQIGTAEEWRVGRPRFRKSVTITEDETTFVHLQ